MILLSIIEDALRAEDIEGFIELGAPKDEYEDEAKAIADAMFSLSQDQHTEANIVKILSSVWAESFHRSQQEIAMRMTAFRRVANKLLTQDY